MKKTILLASICVVGFRSSFIRAAPTGACACDGGMAAVGGSHVLGSVVTGLLADGGFDLIVNDIYKLDPEILTSVETGKNISLSIKGGPFRGILLRMGGEGITMTPGDGFQMASACMEPNVAGITHTTNTEKSGLTKIGDFRVSSSQRLEVDVTVVVSNNANDGSVYYYNPYKIKTAGDLPNTPLPDTIEPRSANLATTSPTTMVPLPAECMATASTSNAKTATPEATDPPTLVLTHVPTAAPTVVATSPAISPFTTSVSPLYAPLVPLMMLLML